MSLSLEQQVQQLAGYLLAQGKHITTAESCTGGGIAQALTTVAGSSAWFDYGFVTYSNEAKSTLLGVPENLLETHGAVSQEVVEAMTAGALRTSGADIAVAVSGVAGPDGGTEEKPVGMVWLCWQQAGQQPHSRQYHFSGNRSIVRQAAVRGAISGLLETVGADRVKK